MRFKPKSKFGISMMITFIMLFQIIGPVAYAYADRGLGFKILDVDIEDGKAIVNWRITLDANYESEEYTYPGNFTVEEEKTGPILADDGTVIGEYTVSKDGLITVTTDGSLKDVIEEEIIVPEIPIEPEQPIAPEIPEEEKGEEDLENVEEDEEQTQEENIEENINEEDNINEEEEDIEETSPEEIEHSENEDGEQTEEPSSNENEEEPEKDGEGSDVARLLDNIVATATEAIGSATAKAVEVVENEQMRVALLSSSEETEPETEKAPKTISFEGSFVIEGVEEKPAFYLFGMMPFGGGTPQEIESNRVTMEDFKLIINGKDILQLTEEERAALEIEQTQSAQFTVTFNLDLDGISPLYAAGDYFEFDFPTAVKNYGNFSGRSLAADDDPIFNFEPVTGENQTIRVSLAADMDPAQASNGIKVTMNFYSEFELSGEDLEQEITIPKLDGSGGTETIQLTFMPISKDDPMTKESLGFTIVGGERYIDWEIWVNEAGKTLNGARITDTPSTSPEHVIVSKSVNVFQYEIGLSGVDRNGPGTSMSYGGETDVDFPDIELNGKYAYKITYQTQVINPLAPYSGEQRFRNTARLTSPGYPTETVNGEQKIVYGEALAKRKVGTGSNYESSWEIKYNYNLASIDVPTAGSYHIVDTFPGVHDIDLTSIVVMKMEVDDEGNVLDTGTVVTKNIDYTLIDAGNDGFKINFNQTVTAPYKITYNAEYPLDFYTGESQTLTNTVTAAGKTVSAEHSISKGILSKGYTLDVDAQELTWTISIHADNEDITDLTLTDDFAEADDSGMGKQTLIGGVDGITIIGTTETTPTILIQGDSPSTEGFIISNIKITKDNTAIITYKTKYDIVTDGKVAGEYRNTATAEWSSSGEDFTISDSDSYRPQTTTQNNGRKTGTYNYNTQTFTWGIIVNFNKQNINGAIIEDTLGPGHDIVDGSLRIYDFTPSGDDSRFPEYTYAQLQAFKGSSISLTNPEHYTVDYTETDGKKTEFKLTFSNNLDSVNKNNKAYYVEYQTKDSDHIIGLNATEESTLNLRGTYTNEATFTTSTEHDLTSTPVVVAHANHLISKAVDNLSSNTNGILTWTVDVNKSLSDIGVVTLTDQPSDNLMLLPDSIEIRPMNSIGPTGTISYGSWTPASDDDLTIDLVAGSFTLELGNLSSPTRKAVQVRYKTHVLGSTSGNQFSNNATIQYNNTVEEDDVNDSNHSTNRSFAFSFSDATSSSTKGSIKFQKFGVDQATGNEIPLEGIDFQLIKKIGGTDYIIQEDSTEADGTLTFENVKYGTYFIREKAAPDGYLQMSDEEFTLSATNNILIFGNENKIIELQNIKINQGIKLTKEATEDSTKKLAGAVFELYRSDDTLVTVDKNGNSITEAQLTTDSEGIIVIDDLEIGSYYLKEVTAPDGYWLDTTPIPFTVNAGNVVINEETITNTKQGDIIIKKVDQEMEPLDGAEFTLTEVGNSANQYTSESTSEAGTLKFRNVKYGTYRLAEIKAPPGYVVATNLDLIINDIIVGDLNNIEINPTAVAATITNEKIHQAVELSKVDDATGEALEGAEFTLHRADDSQVFTNEDGEPLGKLVTNAAGKLTVNKLAPDTYYFKEVKSPQYYLLPQDDAAKTSDFTIEKDQTVTDTVTMTNTRGVGSIIITKVDALDNSILLADVEFKLYNNDRLIERIGTTGADGTITFNNLPYDTYTLEEVAPKDGYISASSTKRIVLNSDINNRTVEEDVDNQPLRTLRIEKVDARDNTRVLAGAEFKITKPGGVTEEFTTDENGLIKLEDLGFGTYTIEEIKAPSGYRLNTTVENVVINENSDLEVEIVIENIRRSSGGGGGGGTDPKDPEEPTTPGETPEKPEEKPKPVDPTNPTVPGETPEIPTQPTEPTEPGETPEVPEEPVVGEETPEIPPIEGTVEIPEEGTPEIGTPPSNGTVTIDKDGNWKYTPNPGFTGKDQFTVKVVHPDGTIEEILIEVDVEEIPLGTATPKGENSPTGTEKLPQTGEGSLLNNYLIGGLMALLGYVVLRKKKDHQEA